MDDNDKRVTVIANLGILCTGVCSELKMVDGMASNATKADHLLDQVYAYLMSKKYSDDAKEYKKELLGRKL